MAGYTAVATDCHADVLTALRANATLNSVSRRGTGGQTVAAEKGAVAAALPAMGAGEVLVRRLDWLDAADTDALAV